MKEKSVRTTEREKETKKIEHGQESEKWEKYKQNFEKLERGVLHYRIAFEYHWRHFVSHRPLATLHPIKTPNWSQVWCMCKSSTKSWGMLNSMFLFASIFFHEIMPNMVSLFP